MTNIASIPLELNFLQELLGERETQYRRAFWLQSEFKQDVWECDFERYKKTIDFRVNLPDGKKLTDSKHTALLETFKCFLCVQTHHDATGGKKLNSDTACKIVESAIKLIDYFLLNAEHYQLDQHGLSSLTESELTAILFEIGSCNKSHQFIYRWRERLSQFLKDKVKSLRHDIITDTLIKFPMLKDNGVHEDQCVLGLTGAERVHARVWIHLNGFYHASIGAYDTFRKTPNTKKFSTLIYVNTIGGKNANLPQFPELGFEPATYTAREYGSVIVRSNDTEQRMSKNVFMSYCRVLRNMGLLQIIGLPVPVQALKVTNQQRLVELSNLGTMGRFRTLPSHVVFSSLRQAIEFGMTYGQAIVDSYLAVVVAANAAGKTLLQWQHEKIDITDYLTPDIKTLGVKRWTIQERNEKKIFLERLYNSEYYTCLRTSPGLWELLRVLYGAVQLVVGTLMARRQGELSDLVATKCLDKGKRHLVFFARKTGYDGKRERVARPIPAVAANLIEVLEQLQLGLKRNGIIDKYYPLFSYPNARLNKLTNKNTFRFNGSLNYFCDYIETPLNRDGNRYYICQHQLRRFFAMLFFWGSSFGGMDTLRWFFSHTDVEHLYHYITESTPGSVLHGAQAHYATEQIQAYNESASSLADLLEKRFSTRKFDLMNSNELDEYIEDLIEEGQVTVNPEFFENENGKDYRILIKVSGKV